MSTTSGTVVSHGRAVPFEHVTVVVHVFVVLVDRACHCSIAWACCALLSMGMLFIVSMSVLSCMGLLCPLSMSLCMGLLCLAMVSVDATCGCANRSPSHHCVGSDSYTVGGVMGDGWSRG